MKKIIPLIIAVAVIAAAIVFLPELIHRCDDCEEIFFGVGYEPNIIEDLISTESEQIICKECAENQHKVSIALGKDVDEYKREMFD